MGILNKFTFYSKIGEDFDDNLPTKGKRYYMSHAEYVYKNDSEAHKIFGNESIKLTQLVCASNMENARKAVEESLGKNKIIFKIRIDNLIVGN